MSNKTLPKKFFFKTFFSYFAFYISAMHNAYKQYLPTATASFGAGEIDSFSSFYLVFDYVRNVSSQDLQFVTSQ